MSVDEHGADLPAPAHAAWRAYCAMLASKDAHFTFLDSLHRRYELGGTRTLAEIARLDQLLDDHDRCVQHFAREMRALGTADRAAHALLVNAMTRLNQTLGATPAGSTGH